MKNDVGHPRTALDLARARSAHCLISGQGRLKIIRTRLGQEGAKREGVLDGRVRALPVVGKHRVGRVAEQHLAAVVPTKQRTQNEQPQRTLCGTASIISVTADANPREADWLLVPDIDLPLAFGVPRLRAPRQRQGSSRVCVPANGEVQKMCHRAHPELDRLWVGHRRKLVCRYDPAEATCSRVDEIVLSGDRAPYCGAHAVGAHDEVGMLDTTVGELELDRAGSSTRLTKRQPRCSP